MSPRASRRVLFLTSLLLVPLPMLTFDAFVPVARYLLLGAVCVGMRIAEGPGGVVWQLAALFFGHAVVYGLLLWLAAWAAGRALGALPARVRTGAIAFVVIVCGVWALATRPYVTTFGPAARANLVEVLR